METFREITPNPSIHSDVLDVDIREILESTIKSSLWLNYHMLNYRQHVVLSYNTKHTQKILRPLLLKCLNK